MHYKRRTRYSSWHHQEQPSKVQVSITWDPVTNAAYRLKFDNIGKHWAKIQPIVDLIKASISSAEREYDPDTKTWFIAENRIKPIKEFCELIPEFEVIFVAKPDEIRATRFHSTEADLAEFKRLVSFAHISFTDTTDLSEAIKTYRKAAMHLHPDRHPDMASEMSALNEVWSRLKGAYFK
jgi:hypothetical protein